MDEKIKIMQCGYTSEWALARFFPALFKHGMDDFFDLIGITEWGGKKKEEAMGGKKKEEAIQRIITEIKNRANSINSKENWRIENTLEEIINCSKIAKKLSKNQLRDYVFDKNNNNLPYNDFDAAIIFTKNPTHIDYIERLLNHKKHILCEKPIVTVTDENHNADRIQLEKLVEKNSNADLVLMDAEHYSAKKAAIAFYENIEDLVAEYGKIARINAVSMEKDDPEKPRTKCLLSRENRTGLLLDMGVHYFGIIHNINGKVNEIKNAEYSAYSGFDVETYVKTEFSVSGEKYFHENAEAEFTFAKFADKFKENPNEKDLKQYSITFRNEQGKETTAVLDFIEGTLTDSQKNIWKSKTSPSNQEYVNILKEFHDSVKNKKPPRTSFSRSIQNLDAIYRTYETFPVYENINKVYNIK